MFKNGNSQDRFVEGGFLQSKGFIWTVVGGIGGAITLYVVSIFGTSI